MYYALSNLDSDIYTLEYFLQNDVCRLCWNIAAGIEIFQNSTKDCQETEDRTLAERIRDCLSIDLSTEMAPNKLCKTCFENIEHFCNFKSFCYETDKKLHSIFSNYDYKERFVLNPAPYIAKVESVIQPKTESIDDFLDSLRPSDRSSDDELPLKSIQKQKNAATKAQNRNKSCYCNICKTEFAAKDTLLKHNAEAHGHENGYFKCFGCGKKCKTRRGRVGHETRFCKDLKDGYKCPTCSNFLPTRGHYERHMKGHRENGSVTLPEVTVKCRSCSLTFKTKEALVTHSKAEHNGVKKFFVCESCGRVFTRADYLHKHKLTHTGTKQHVCAHCGFRTTQRTSLTVHIRTHTGERPYSCDLCPQRCVSSSNLKAHRRRHTGDKKYECSLCAKKFGYKSSLEEHVASAHGRGRAHACAHCGAEYTRARGLKRHVASKHKQNGVDLTEAVPKSDAGYAKLQNEPYVKALEAKAPKGGPAFELKEFDSKLSCVNETEKCLLSNRFL